MGLAQGRVTLDGTQLMQGGQCPAQQQDSNSRIQRCLIDEGSRGILRRGMAGVRADWLQGNDQRQGGS